MKYCEEYALVLSAFVDGELSEAEKSDALNHVETCEGCRAYLAELMAMHAAFGSLEEYDAPDGFAERVMDRLHEEAAPKKRTHRRAWMGLAACAAVVMITVAGFPRMGSAGDSEECAADCAAPAVAESQEVSVEEEFTDTYTSVQRESLMACAGIKPKEDMSFTETAELPLSGAENAANNLDMPAEGSALPESGDEHAVFYALSDEAEAFLLSRGMGESIYEENGEKCSYLVPVELVREMVEQNLLTETRAEQTPLEAVAEGSVIVIVRIAEETQP